MPRSVWRHEVSQKAGCHAHCKLLKSSRHNRRVEVFQKVWLMTLNNKHHLELALPRTCIEDPL